MQLSNGSCLMAHLFKLSYESHAAKLLDARPMTSCSEQGDKRSQSKSALHARRQQAITLECMLPRVAQIRAGIKRRFVAPGGNDCDQSSIDYLGGFVETEASCWALPPASASDRKRTSKSSCSSPFSDMLLPRLRVPCNTSLQWTQTTHRLRGMKAN